MYIGILFIDYQTKCIKHYAAHFKSKLEYQFQISTSIILSGNDKKAQPKNISVKDNSYKTFH